MISLRMSRFVDLSPRYVRPSLVETMDNLERVFAAR
jgi:hypothetical protein